MVCLLWLFPFTWYNLRHSYTQTWFVEVISILIQQVFLRAIFLGLSFPGPGYFAGQKSESAAGEDGEAGDGRQRPDGGRGPEIRGHAPDVGGAWRRRPTERDEQILKCIDTTLWFQLILISFTEIQLTKQVKIKAIEVMCSAGVCQSSQSIYLCQPLREISFEMFWI